MFRFKPTAIAVILLAATAGHAQFTDVINSNRPGESMAAFSVGKTVFQTEGGINWFKEKHEVLGYESTGLNSELDFRYGAIFEQLEFIANLQYQFDHFTAPLVDRNRSGMKQITLGAKFLVYDPNKNYEKKPNLYSWKANHSFSWHEFIPAVGVYAGVNVNVFKNPYDFPDEEKLSPKLMFLTQNQFGKWAFVTNIFADKMLTHYMSYGYVATLTRGFNERWSGFVENQGIKGDYYSDGIFRLGAAFLIKENIQVDASIGKNVKDTPSIFTGGIGFSWRFDENYQDVLLRAPKDDKEDKKSKEEKKKEKEAKKRKDAIEGTETK